MTSELDIPLFDPDIGDAEIAAVTEVLRSKWLTMGDRTERFEIEFAEFVGCPHAIAVNSCTSALHLALLVAGIRDGDEVICPSLTFVATANAIRYCGAKPIFADIFSMSDWNISAETIEPLLNKSTRAIIVVHYAGYVCDMAPILELAKRQNIAVIEDAAHAPGASRDGMSAGSIGDLACFSFFSNKNITTGEGGMIATHKADVTAKLRNLRSHAMTSPTLDRHRGHAFTYDVDDLGYNYRMSELNAALGITQLKRLREGNRRRAELVSRYRYRLADLPGIQVPFIDHDGTPAFHIMPILLPAGCDRGRVMKDMRKRGVQTSMHYRPIDTFSSFRESNGNSNRHLDKTHTVGERTMTLPLFPSMTDEMVGQVVSTLADALVLKE